VREQGFSRGAFYEIILPITGGLCRSLTGLFAIMKCQKKESDIEYTAVELLRPVAGVHKDSEHREFITVWQKEPGTPINSIARSIAEAAMNPQPVRYL
jgi:hypothetical protein